MKENLKLKWLLALTSGEYRQGRYTLCDRKPGGNEYCCLGVLADVSGVGEWQPYEMDSDTRFVAADTTDSIAAFNDEVLALFGLTEEQQGKLASMNDRERDGQRMTFEEIGQWIDKNVEAQR